LKHLKKQKKNKNTLYIRKLTLWHTKQKQVIGHMENYRSRILVHKSGILKKKESNPGLNYC